MTQIRELTDLSREELLALLKIERLEFDLLREELNRANGLIDKYREVIARHDEYLEAIGAGGVSARRISGEPS